MRQLFASILQRSSFFTVQLSHPYCDQAPGSLRHVRAIRHVGEGDLAYDLAAKTLGVVLEGGFALVAEEQIGGELHGGFLGGWRGGESGLRDRFCAGLLRLPRRRPGTARARRPVSSIDRANGEARRIHPAGYAPRSPTAA